MPGLAYPILTERLALRPFVEGDLDDLYEIHSDPRLTPYLYWEPRDREQTREALDKKLRQTDPGEDGSTLILAVELVHPAGDTAAAAAGKVIGDMTLHCRSKAHRQGEIGFVFNRAYHGHGYATEASLAVLDLGFSEFGFHRIAGRCDVRNAASYKLMERLGMRREACFLENEYVKGEWVSELVYALLATEWRARQDAVQPATAKGT